MNATIRYFCHVTPEAGDAWGDLGFAYYRAMRDLTLSLRVVPLGAADLGRPEHRWDGEGAAFARALDPGATSVACGTIADLRRVHLPSLRNLAIVVASSTPRPRDLDVLGRFDAVIVPDRESLLSLLPLGPRVRFAPPERDSLAQLFQPQIAARVHAGSPSKRSGPGGISRWG